MRQRLLLMQSSFPTSQAHGFGRQLPMWWILLMHGSFILQAGTLPLAAVIILTALKQVRQQLSVFVDYRE